MARARRSLRVKALRQGRKTSRRNRADRPTRKAAVPAGPTMGYSVLAKEVPAESDTIPPIRAR
ncbi:hypothetical protein D3C80_2185090 [compost metagenome]